MLRGPDRGEGNYHARFKETIAWEDRGTHENGCYIRLAIEIADIEQVTKYREVTEYREVPVKVEKQREVTVYRKISILEWLLKN